MISALRFDQTTIEVKKGDFISKPAGKGLAHQFVNNGKETLEILDCGTKEKGDVVSYPDENVLLVKDLGLAFKKDKSENHWSSDPN